MNPAAYPPSERAGGHDGLPCPCFRAPMVLPRGAYRTVVRESIAPWRRTLRLAKAIVLALAALSLGAISVCAKADSDISAVERRLLELFRSRNPGLVRHGELSRLIDADEYAQRAAVLVECRAPRGLRDRLFDERYRLLLERLMSRHREIAAQAGLDLSLTEFHVALLHVFRNSEERARRDWVAYFETPGAQAGRDRAMKLQALTDYERFGIEYDTGRTRSAWLHWLDEYLRLAELREAFLRSADRIEPGLADAFAGFVASPENASLSPERQRQLETLTARLAPRLADIAEEMKRSADPGLEKSALEWAEHPMLARVLAIRDGIVANEPKMQPLRARAGYDADRLKHVVEAWMRSDKEDVAKHCASFR